MTGPTGTPTLAAIARPSGALAMVAMDQRERLRTMFDGAAAGRPADDVLVRFKLDVARAWRRSRPGSASTASSASTRSGPPVPSRRGRG